ncbi:MAG: CDP-alcohol phosphatidyltransferase family protein [Deltaproteobacteria bacterium]|nr:CDP-alcohol phosphatidyltransferase family protein [Deltaproteobacteria bacterium]
MHVQLSILAVALLVMAGFACRDLFSSRHASARVQKQGASPFLGHFPMEVAYWLLTPVGKLAASLKLSPNMLSWTCLVLGLASGVAAALGAIPLAGGLSIVSALFDTLDGMVARSRGIASDAGEVLDAAVDRYTEFFFLAGLCVYYRHEPWAMVLVQAALLGSFLVSYSQAKAEALQCDIPKGWMRRPERAAYLGGGAFLSPIVTVWLEAGDPLPLHYPLLFAVLLVAIFANATAIRRFVVLYHTLRGKAAGGNAK